MPAPAAEGLSDDAVSILTGLRKTLRATSVSEEARASKCAHGLQQLLAYSELADMRLACEAIEASSLPDEGLLCACQAAASPDVSARVAACFASSMLLPRLASLEQPASRTLFSALLLMLKQHARPVLESLITPALFANAGQLSSAQVEALTRLLKELPQALLGKALADFLQGDAAAGPAPNAAGVDGAPKAEDVAPPAFEDAVDVAALFQELEVLRAAARDGGAGATMYAGAGFLPGAPMPGAEQALVGLAPRGAGIVGFSAVPLSRPSATA